MRGQGDTDGSEGGQGRAEVLLRELEARDHEPCIGPHLLSRGLKIPAIVWCGRRGSGAPKFGSCERSGELPIVDLLLDEKEASPAAESRIFEKKTAGK